MKIDTSKAQPIFDQFIEVTADCIDQHLFSKVVDYKRRVASQFTSIGKDGIPKIRGRSFFISRKLDGEHCQLFYEDGQIALIRPRGFAFLNLPCLDQAREILERHGIKRCLMPGELYVRRPDGKRTRVFDVVHHTKAPRSREDLEMLAFAPFDIQWCDNEIYVDFAQIYNRIHELFAGTPLEPPTWVHSEDRNAVDNCYRQWVEEEEAEGLMIRTDLTYRYKLKAQHTIDAVIIGYIAEEDLVTQILVALVHEDGTLQVTAKIEKGMNDIQRRDLFQQLQPLHTPSDYTEISSKHTPFVMVQPKLIIEFSCNDMSTHRANGKPIRTAVLKLKQNHYRLSRGGDWVSLHHCVFHRFREDKQVNPVDLRTSQITDFVFLELGDHSGEELQLPEVDKLMREVWIKEQKGKVAVRKFMVWKTNKEHIDAAFTAFVFNFTDYSQGRKDPLKMDTRISDSQEQIMAIAAEFKEKHIKKGWSRHPT